jgi:uncharacterized protein YjbJ (UPF0337 family)
MDSDRVTGSARQAGGAVKEVVGNMTGDSKLQTEGAIDRLVGRIENTFGGLKDTVREGYDAVSDLSTGAAIVETTKRYPVLALGLTAALTALATWAIAGSHSARR